MTLHQRRVERIYPPTFALGARVSQAAHHPKLRFAVGTEHLADELGGSHMAADTEPAPLNRPSRIYNVCSALAISDGF